MNKEQIINNGKQQDKSVIAALNKVEWDASVRAVGLKNRFSRYALSFTIMFFLFVFMQSGCGKNSDDAAKTVFSIKSGESAYSIVSRLKKDNLIFSKTLFLAYAKFNGSTSKIKAGYYEFSRKDGMFKILDELKSGSKSLIKFTIPEGSNIKQTAEIIASKGTIDKDKFIRIASDRNMEGYLMPETYFIDPIMKEEDIIDTMKKEFDKKVTPEMYERANELDTDMDKIITLASIVEKEAVNPDERAIIAAVFYNRIQKRIRLESCATVLYAMGVNKARLTREDTFFDSPYNTYRHLGLPPGPICSPGIESIKAALYPANSSSLFFVSKGNGSHLFAESLDEHVKNKQETKKIIKKRQKSKQAD
ncbi:MAG: endolytic transglycosylase MltG [Endomicrobia bacterium]|nr:endolytic transglycosylase MltG [Endomicrobiia bacterium]